MAQLPTPQNLRLAGGSPEPRQADRLRITFDHVAEATRYQAEVNGMPWLDPIAPDAWLENLASNYAYRIKVKAQADGYDDSGWSEECALATRPPTPHAPERRPFDLQGWGIVLDWLVAAGWTGSAQGEVELLRAESGSAPALIERYPGLTGRHVDTTYPTGVVKAYHLKIVVANGPLGGENRSLLGLDVTATGPLGIIPTLASPSIVIRLRERRERAVRAALGLTT